MDTKELDNMIPEDERPAMILPSDPEEPAEDPSPAGEEQDTAETPVSGPQPEPSEPDPSPDTETPEPAEHVKAEATVPETDSSGEASEAAVAEAAEESKEKKKTMLRLGIIIGAFLLLIGLGIGWFFMMGPGATKYMIQFDPAGGKDVDLIWVRKGKAVDLPETAREGYEFKGWTLNGKDAEDPFTPESDTKLVAKWEAMTFKVSYNSAGGTPAQFESTYKTGDPVTAPAEPTKDGFTFVRWNDADNKPFKFGDPMPANDIYLFAEWSENSYKVTFDTDGGSAVEPLVLKEGAKFPEVKTTKKYYTFDHWEDKSGKTVKAGDVLPAEDITLYAKWKRDTFKVSFDSNGGSSVSSVTVDAGDELKLPSNPTKENYNFVRWEDKNGTPIYDKALLEPHDITLYAVWERKTFKVSFDSRGGSSVAAITVNAGDTLTLPPDPTKPGYTFGVWESSSGTAILDGALLTPDDITLYARWRQEQFTVTFDTDGGSYVAPITLNDGDKLYLPPDPTRPWSKFVRWEDSYGNPIPDQMVFWPEDMTLYAVWESVTQLSVGPVGDTSAIESIAGTDTFLNINVYSNWSMMRLEANMDVEWKVTDNYGCLYSLSKGSDWIQFLGVYNAVGCEAEIKAVSSDGQTFRVTIYPIDETPST